MLDLLIIIIIIIIIVLLLLFFYRVGREYRIYSKGVEGGNKGNKSCPEYSKVLREITKIKSLSNKGQDLLPLLPLMVGGLTPHRPYHNRQAVSI